MITIYLFELTKVDGTIVYCLMLFLTGLGV